ncbi:DUF167 family protein [Breoghania sp.]|uniref:DUF167 family protein n=1 Tax=Breoghania sp. TaxID=2065378 RepID=UPI0029C9D215|nr:DUF167 family protein [Breoghania sp.]
MTQDVPWRAADGGVRIALRLTPKASRDQLDGLNVLSDGRVVLAARVRAVPDKGAANKALEKLISKTLKVPSRDVSVEAGHTARLKTLFVQGDEKDLIQGLEALALPRSG